MESNRKIDVGKRIRALREKNGWSLREVAGRSGLSINAISRIERGDNSPTVASLHLLADALYVPITEFFVVTSEDSVIYVTPADRIQAEYQENLIESLGTGLRDQQLEPFIVTVQAGHQQESHPITHAGQEFVYSLSGTLHYQINDDVYVLRQGHSLLFDASQPHHFWNPTTAPAQLLFVFQTTVGQRMTFDSHLNLRDGGS